MSRVITFAIELRSSNPARAGSTPISQRNLIPSRSRHSILRLAFVASDMSPGSKKRAESTIAFSFTLVASAIDFWPSVEPATIMKAKNFRFAYGPSITVISVSRPSASPFFVRFVIPSAAAISPGGRSLSCTTATVPAGMHVLASFRSIAMLLAFLAALRCGAEFRQEASEVRRFKLREKSGTILRRKSPGVRTRAHERPLGALAVAFVDPLISDDLVDDARELATGLGALELRLPGCDVEVVDDALENSDEDH